MKSQKITCRRKHASAITRVIFTWRQFSNCFLHFFLQLANSSHIFTVNFINKCDSRVRKKRHERGELIIKHRRNGNNDLQRRWRRQNFSHNKKKITETMTESEELKASTNDEISDDEQQLIKLSLKKPKLWNWELTTSKSSSSIAFPTIQLFDENSQTLLAVANEADFVASSKMCGSASEMTSGASSLRSARTKDSFKIKISRDSISEFASENAGDVRRKRNSASSMKFIGRPNRSASSTSIRSRSSILERISEMKKDLSTSSSDEETVVEDQPKMCKKYSYRTSKVGTLLVPKESFSTEPRRRPRKPYQVVGADDEVDKVINSCSGESKL